MMEKTKIVANIDRARMTTFVACPGLGALHAIREGALPAEAGIWMPGAPRTRDPLRESRLVDERVIDVFQMGRGLPLLLDRRPSDLPTTTEAMVRQLQEVPADHADQEWWITWHLADDNGDGGGTSRRFP